MLYLRLCATFLLLGAFSFGGGLGSMELIRSRVVNQQGWMTDAEFTDIISISEMTPGPLGINIASFVGVRVAGVPGTVIATLSYVLPSFFLVMLLALCYYRWRQLDLVKGFLKGLRPAVAAMVMTTAVKLTANALWGGLDKFPGAETNLTALALCAVCTGLLLAKKLTPVKAILFSGAVGACIYAVLGI